MAPVTPDEDAWRQDDRRSEAGQRDREAGQRDDAALSRDAGASERDGSAKARDQDAGERDVASAGRDRDGHRRDDEAALRDDASARRDHAADERDTLAELRDRPSQPYPTQRRELGRLLLARRAAAADREHSREDRSAEARSRSFAHEDRGFAERDREHSILDRSAAEHDRDAASADRGAGGAERTAADEDRQDAHDDRDDAAADRRTASLDELTGAYLRGPGLLQVDRDLGRARRNGEPLVVVFADVDHLKAVNDQRGHAAGDRLLRQFVATLQSQLRPHDLIMRFGGDEFVCVITGLELHDVTRRLIDTNSLLADGPAPGTVTFGLAQLQPDDTAHDVIDRADAALYELRSHRAPDAS